jgi:hypothetical protein
MDYRLDASDFMKKDVYEITELVARIRNDGIVPWLLWSGFVLAYIRVYILVMYISYHMAGIGTFLKSSGSRTITVLITNVAIPMFL